MYSSPCQSVQNKSLEKFPSVVNVSDEEKSKHHNEKNEICHILLDMDQKFPFSGGVLETLLSLVTKKRTGRK